MKRILSLVPLLAVGIVAAQQRTPAPAPVKPIRIPVYHADPWFIVAMLEGQFVQQPELSTILGFMGAPPQTGQALDRIFKGKFFVNPTDNSIWFIPDPST